MTLWCMWPLAVDISHDQDRASSQGLSCWPRRSILIEWTGHSPPMVSVGGANSSKSHNHLQPAQESLPLSNSRLSSPPNSPHNRRMADLPVACTLSPAALQARRANLLHVLLRRTMERRELPNGYSLRFAAESDVLSEIAHAVENERQCCRFLRFTVTVEPDDGPITVEFTGPAGTKEFRN